MKTNIKLKDSAFAHQEYTSPYNSSKYIIWDRTSDIYENDMVVYTDGNLHGCRPDNKNNIGWLIEPREFQPHNYEWVENNYHRFAHIWSHDSQILNLPNVKFVPWGSCWISPEDQKIYEKDKLCNIIASGKNQLKGHRLRHHIINNFAGFDKFGHGYNPVEHKILALGDYMFSICIENTKYPLYFSEKIIDCFRTGTIPIYWGCERIDEFFNPDGILQFDTFEKFQEIMDNISYEKYKSMELAIKENFELASKYLAIEDWIIENKIL